MKNFKLNEQQKEIYDFIENNDTCVFIQGQAGTGKSSFITYFCENTKKKVCVVAPTGTAALNVNGTTIHKLFRLAPLNFFDISTTKIKKVSTPEDADHWISPAHLALLKSIDTMIIDEISMVRPDIFDVMDRVLKTIRNNNEPYGGVQVVGIGDVYQLPSVIKSEVRDLFFKEYGLRNPHFFDSHSFKKAHFKKFEFTEVYRQQDPKLLEHLMNLRVGKKVKAAVDYFNDQKDLNEKDFENAIILTTRRDRADEINQAKLNEINSSPRHFLALCKGSFANTNETPSPKDLVLKLNAHVVFTKNDTLEKEEFEERMENNIYEPYESKWVNGTTGIVTGFSGDTIVVKLNHNGREVLVKPVTWEMYEQVLTKEKVKDEKTGKITTVEKIEHRVSGEFIQFPLQLGYAMTIHKAQGKTLEKVIVDPGEGMFTTGQAYVGLSRTSFRNDLYLKSPLSESDIKVDKAVIKFLNSKS